MKKADFKDKWLNTFGKELFIVSKDWSWTYVCSHEDDDDENGPFFMYNENT